MSNLVAAVEFPAYEVRVGDVLLDPESEKATVVAAVEQLGNSVRIQCDNGADGEVQPGGKVTLLVPVLRDWGGVIVPIYKGDGSGHLGCTCVYRYIDGEGYWYRVPDSDEHCRCLGHGALVDED